MIKLPQKIWLTRKEVISAVGGREQLRHLEQAGRLQRAHPGGLVHARYTYAQVKRVLDDLGAGAS